GWRGAGNENLRPLTKRAQHRTGATCDICTVFVDVTKLGGYEWVNFWRPVSVKKAFLTGSARSNPRRQPYVSSVSLAKSENGTLTLLKTALKALTSQHSRCVALTR